MKGDDILILVIRLTKEQNLALVTRYPTEIIRAGIEHGVQDIADQLIEENKIIEENKEGPSLPGSK